MRIVSPVQAPATANVNLRRQEGSVRSLIVSARIADLTYPAVPIKVSNGRLSASCQSGRMGMGGPKPAYRE